MRNVIRVAGIDPSLSNFGLARMMLNTETLELSCESVTTISTEKMAGKRKGVRQNSDDLRRARELHDGFHAQLKDCVIAFTEVPSGSQGHRAALGFGIAIGVLASSPVQLIEVMPEETKMASVGVKTAEKSDIISWAATTYPHIPWLTYQRDVTKGSKIYRRAGDLHLDNEHSADACAVVHAGIRTVQFQQLLALWKAIPTHGS